MSTQGLEHAAGSPPPGPPRKQENSLLSVLRVLVLIAGAGIAALGLSCSALGMLATVVGGAEGAVQMATVYTGASVLTGSLGLALVWHAWRAIQHRQSAPFQPPAAWLLLALFVAALAAGQVVLSFDLLPALTFPPAHVFAAIIPPLAIVGMVGSALRGAGRWRDVTLQLAGGVFLSTPAAFVLEAVMLFCLLAAAMVSVAIQPGGQEIVIRLADRLSALPAQDPAALYGLLTTPLVLAGVVLVVALLVPLIEELVKTAGVALMAYRRPSAAQALLWGVTAGAGFAMVEGLFNTVGSLEGWALLLFLRIGATLLHCFTGGLMGLAWYHTLAGRWPRGVGLYATSIGVHAAWNALSVGMTVLSVRAGAAGEMTRDLLLAGAGTMTILAGLALLTLGIVAGLVWLVHRVRAGATQAEASHPARPLRAQQDRPWQ